MRSLVNPAPLWFASAALALAAFVACQPGVKLEQEGLFAIDNHSLLPPEKAEGEVWRTSIGVTPQPVDAQPIAFNHKIHASTVEEGGLGMDCQYCHSNARQSKHGGVPSSQVCNGCHQYVSIEGRSEEGTKALTQVKDYWTKGEPIPWVKVHDLPDFVHFNHSRHVKGGVQCTECHADMTKETVAVRAASMTMTMGWCLDCHSGHPSVDTNYGVNAELRRAELKDCYTCHK